MAIGFEATKKCVLCSTKYILNDLQLLEAQLVELLQNLIKQEIWEMALQENVSQSFVVKFLKKKNCIQIKFNSSMNY